MEIWKENIGFVNANCRTFKSLLDGKPDTAGILEVISNRQGPSVAVSEQGTPRSVLRRKLSRKVSKLSLSRFDSTSTSETCSGNKDITRTVI